MTSQFPRVNRLDALARTALGGALSLTVIGMTMWGLQVATEPLEPCTDTSTSVCTGVPVDHSPNGAPKESTRFCATEDSVDCVWSAPNQGNGEGRSLSVDADGTVTYLP
ncbi:hypothetical protein SEA_PHINKY_105 [Microbacterium phage Phinky]|nr:hypothetical protein SEA_PHINKY_105 [Microbacterium phage Phinky]